MALSLKPLRRGPASHLRSGVCEATPPRLASLAFGVTAVHSGIGVDRILVFRDWLIGPYGQPWASSRVCSTGRF